MKPDYVPGYHLVPIQKGTFGDVSKIQEELDELKDAKVQGSKILAAVEMADLYGALEAYAESMGITMDDIRIMSNITKRAFQNGKRISM